MLGSHLRLALELRSRLEWLHEVVSMTRHRTLGRDKHPRVGTWSKSGLGMQGLGLPLLVLCLAGPLAAQRGAMIAQQNLVQLVEQAGTIVRGRVLVASVQPHPEFPHLHTVLVTFRAEEVLKGNPGKVFTFRQFIWDLRDRYDASGYRKGGEVLLFLTPPSDIGLSSPVGLGQGRFRIVRDAQRNEYIVNEVGNSGLFRGLRAVLEDRGAVLSDEQLTLLESFSDGPVSLTHVRRFVKQLMATK